MAGRNGLISRRPALSQKAPARVILAFRKQGRVLACHHAFTTVAMGIFGDRRAHRAVRVDRALEFVIVAIGVRRERHRASYDLKALPHGLVDAKEAAQVQVALGVSPFDVNAQAVA